MLNQTVIDIGDLGNIAKIGPEHRMLKTYVNQIITVTYYTEVKTKLKHKDPKAKTIELTFIDEAGEAHTLLTSAKYLVEQLDEIARTTDFMKVGASTVVKGRLIAEKIFGKFRNFRLIPLDKPKAVFDDDDDVEEIDDDEEE